MAEFEEVINLKTKTTGTDSVKSLKQEIRETEAAAIQAARKFGDFSPQAEAAAKKVAKLKDEMQDFRQRVAGLNPDRFEAIATVVQGVAGGISAAAGAMALFGGESEDVTKLLAKVQGAIAFSQGIQQILNLQNSLGAVAGVIRGQLITAFTTLRGAIISTGIGALIVAAGILASKLSEAGNEAEDAAKKVKEQLEGIESFESKSDQLITLRIARLKQLNGTQEKVFELEQQRTKNRIRDIDILLQNEEEGSAESEALAKEKSKLLIQLEIDRANHIADLNAKERDLQKQNNQKALEEQKKANEESLQEQKEWADAWDQLNKEQEDRAKASADAQKEIQNEIAKGQLDSLHQQKFDIDQWYEDKKAILIAGGQSTWELEKLYSDKVNTLYEKDRSDKITKDEKTAEEAKALKKKHDDENLAINKRNFEARQAVEQEAFNNTSALLGQTAQLFGQTTAAGKAFALAQIGADTARALSSALANSQSPTPDNVATGGLAGIAKYIGLAAMILQNINRARQILGASGSTQSGTPQAPSFNPVTPGSLPGSDQVAGQMSNSKVYVLEGDISSSQRRVRNNRGVSVI